MGRLTPTRRAQLVLSLGGFGIGTGEYVILGLLPNVAASLHVSIPHAGYLIFAYALAMLPALQSRIIGMAGGAPNLAAASIHAAFNIANTVTAGTLQRRGR